MVDILAVGGFWLIILAVILRKPVMALIEKSKVQNAEVVALNDRVQKLETMLSTITGESNRISKEMSDLKDAADFSYKLLIEQQEAMKSLQTVRVLPANEGASSQRNIRNDSASNSPKMLSSNAPKQEDYGKIVNDHTVRFERTFPASPEKVWKYFTESDYLKMWLAEGSFEPQFGGRVELNFNVEEMPERRDKGSHIRGLVSRFEPRKALAFSWIDTQNSLESLVSIEFFEESGGDTKVVLTHSRLPQNRMHEFMAGWHAHLDVLMARIKNLMPPEFAERFREVVQVYITIVATVIVTAGPASAAGNDYQIISTERAHLMSRYDDIWRGVDGLQREITNLKRDHSSESEKVIDRLDKELQDKYRDLRQVEFEIRDLDQAVKN